MDVQQTLCELIALPSVNPMGTAASGEFYLETRVTDYLQGVFEAWGLPYGRQTVAPGRDNIYARYSGNRPGVVLLEAHQDTVSVAGMTIPPFEPALREGRIYGRGACDVKGGMAAILTAIAQLLEGDPDDAPSVVLACTVNEEYGFSGAKALADLWAAGRDPILAQPANAALVAEPTELDIVVAHKGVVRWRGHSLGRAAHTSRPERGVNAIYRMAKVISVIEEYATRVLPAVAGHPLCGGPVACVSMIDGGLSVNTVPDRVTIEIDRRIMPGEAPEQAYHQLCDFVLDRIGTDGIEFDSPYLTSAGLRDDANGPLAEQLRVVALDTNRDCRRLGVPYGTDASVIAGMGVPTVVFGPGSIDQAHTADEWIAVDQLHQASEIYHRFLRAFRL